VLGHLAQAGGFVSTGAPALSRPMMRPLPTSRRLLTSVQAAALLVLLARAAGARVVAADLGRRSGGRSGAFAQTRQRRLVGQPPGVEVENPTGNVVRRRGGQ